jgi:ubiquinone/menaquinone biosynthesis C-methylase UbiE
MIFLIISWRCRLSYSSRLEKLAKIYDSDLLPIWGKRFGELLMKNITLPERGMVLDVGCGTGYPALEMINRDKGTTRIIAIDNSGAMMDIARKKAGSISGKRIFFRTENAAEKVSFADEVYDITYSNLAFMELGNPLMNIREFTRVTQIGGQVAITLPLRGTWAEFLDIYREILTKRDKYDLLNKVDEYEKTAFPESDYIVKLMEKGGLTDIKVATEKFELLFKSAREFFFSPIVEYGPLTDWKNLNESSKEMKEIFGEIKNAIDTHYMGLIFASTVEAGCFVGTRPEFQDDGDDMEIEILEEDDIEIIIDDD